MSRIGRRPVAPEIRFFQFVTQDGDCWSWVGWKNGGGYGQFRTLERKVYAHRWSYEYFRDAIPAGLTIDHLCRNRACVNPDHLEPVPMSVNVLRGEAITVQFAGAAHCIWGHEFDEANTIRTPKGRACRSCANRRHSEYRARKQAVA